MHNNELIMGMLFIEIYLYIHVVVWNILPSMFLSIYTENVQGGVQQILK